MNRTWSLIAFWVLAFIGYGFRALLNYNESPLLIAVWAAVGVMFMNHIGERRGGSQ
jgi:hypothetical protein